MYTATLVSKTIQREKQRIVVVVEIVGETSETKEFSFSLNTTIDQIKSTIKQYITELEQAQSIAPQLLEGALDLTVVSQATPEPTQAELDKTAWELDVVKLKKAQELIDCGVTFSAPQLTALATLRTKVATNFKAEYLG